MHATAFLRAIAQTELGAVVIIYGNERALKQSVIDAIRSKFNEDDGDSVTSFPGRDVEFKTIHDELLTISMWSDIRVVVVEEATDFITKNRPALEKLFQRPPKKSLLILDAKSWPKNTKLAKAVTKIGLAVECSALTGNELVQWIRTYASETYRKKISRQNALLLIELVGENLGLLEQELAKLTSFVGEKSEIDDEDVRALVGGWRAEKTWAMTNAARDNNLAEALCCLDKLLIAGEAPQRILGGISFVFRKLAETTELSRSGQPLNNMLKQAGVFPRDVQPAAKYLRRIGRSQAEQIYKQLLQADLDMKGGSRLPERTQLERLIIRLSQKT